MGMVHPVDDRILHHANNRTLPDEVSNAPHQRHLRCPRPCLAGVAWTVCHFSGVASALRGKFASWQSARVSVVERAASESISLGGMHVLARSGDQSEHVWASTRGGVRLVHDSLCAHERQCQLALLLCTAGWEVRTQVGHNGNRSRISVSFNVRAVEPRLVQRAPACFFRHSAARDDHAARAKDA